MNKFTTKVRVNTETGCHEWMGYRRKTDKSWGAYGVFGKRKVYAHRLAWEQQNGAIPKGLQVLHRCDNPSCVNPDHLFLGTQLDNMHDMLKKGRGGHGKNPPRGKQNSNVKLTEDDVRVIRGSQLSNAELGRMYGVTRHTVREARIGMTWAWLGP